MTEEEKVNEQLGELSHKEMLTLDKDYNKAAQAADLLYVNDKKPGIERIRKGDGFSYVYRAKTIEEDTELQRIKKLAIPPAWEKVWICKTPNGHIQATGVDKKGRKQYRYHPLWHLMRNETKFHRLYEFGKVLPDLREKLEKDLLKKELTEEKVMATVVSLMERTYIRIGSDDYEKMYGSYGLTTLKDSHVKINGDTINFSFTGKKGIEQKITLKNRRLANMIKKCKDIPGRELFQYYDAEGKRQPIDSGMVNRYIKEATGGDFSAKDFRTWAGTLNIIRVFKSIGLPESESALKKNVVSALDAVSKQLGNTRTVCKKYYVHPGIIKLYEEQSLHHYLEELDKIEEPDLKASLTTEEKTLMKILKKLV
jgi:DNA topoisomerase I